MTAAICATQSLHAARVSLPYGRVTSVSEQALAGALDTAIIFGAGVGAGIMYHFLALGTFGDPATFAAWAAIVAALFVPFSVVCRTCSLPRRPDYGLLQAFALWAGVFLFLGAVAFTLKVSHELSRGAVLSFASIGFVGIAARRVLWGRISRRAVAVLQSRPRKAVVLGPHDVLLNPKSEALLREANVSVLREFTWESGASRPFSEVIQFLRGSDANEVLVFSTWADWQEDRDLLRILQAVPLPVRLVPDAVMADLVSRSLKPLGSTISVEIQRAPLGLAECAFKRLVDVIGAGLGLIILAPLLAVVALLVRLDSPGPVLFRQTRHGFNGKTFRILKFRTMTVLEDGAQVVQAARNDSRVTRVGRWLRPASIDELPQLFNVLEGTMSLVGPRPHAVAHDNHYSTRISEYAFRHHMKPGLTGWAQVHGFRGETPNVEAMAARVDHDVWYINNWTPLLDIRILIATVFELLRGQKNAY